MAERRTAPRRALALAGAIALIAAALSASVASGASPFKKGRYSGTTNQERVEKEARTAEFRVKGRKISLTQEPAVAKGFCIAAPVFLLDEDRITTRLNRRGAFSFSRTFIGSKIDRIKGRFNDKGEIEGTALYHFRDSDSGLCSAGKSKVKFTAKLRKGN
jgi:hypothetical protein